MESETQEGYDPESSYDQKPYSFHMLRARNALGYRVENRIELANIAISEIRAFLKSNKNDPEALLDLGFLLKETNELDEAIICYKRAHNERACIYG